MLDVTKEKQPEGGSDGEMSGEEWGEGWELVEMPAAPGEIFPLQPGEYEGTMLYPLSKQLVFSAPVGTVTDMNLRCQRPEVERWAYTQPDGTGLLEVKSTTSGTGVLPAEVLTYTIAGGDQPFATVYRSPDCSSFLVRDGNFDPFCTIERADTMFGWEMKIRPWIGNQTLKKKGRSKPAYLVAKKSKSFTVMKRVGKQKVEVARMVFDVPAKEHLAQGVAHSFVVQPGEDLGFMTLALTATARSWQKGEPSNEIGCWKDGVYTRGYAKGSAVDGAALIGALV